MIEEQRCEAYIESNICLEYIIHQIKIDINKIHVWYLNKKNVVILNFGCFIP